MGIAYSIAVMHVLVHMPMRVHMQMPVHMPMRVHMQMPVHMPMRVQNTCAYSRTCATFARTLRLYNMVLSF